MANAGMHALVGTVTRRLPTRKTWLVLGLILGNMFPDLDNYFVAVASVTGRETEGLHRTFTHSVFTILALWVVFFIFSRLRGDERWYNLGLGLGVGVAMHMALDMLIWFNGVDLLWPLGTEYNFWAGYTPPEWLATLVDSSFEFLFFWLYLFWLGNTARKNGTDAARLPALRYWTLAMLVLFILFLPLSYLWGGYYQVYGGLYLVSITAVFVISIRMRATLETV